MQHFRVGGGAGIGAKYLSREDSEVIGLIGSGGMARTFLEAFCCVRPIKECRVYSPTSDHKEAFAEEMSARLGIDVIPVSGPREAIAGADIVSSATDSMIPVYDATWLEPGQHVTNLGRREMPEEAISRFDVVVRQGIAGLQMKQTDIFQAERGHSPAAFIGGTSEQQRVIPEKNPSPGFGGDSPDFMDRGGAVISLSLKISSQVNVREERRETRSRFTGTSATRGFSSRQSAGWSMRRSWPVEWVETYLLSGYCKTSGTS